MENPFHEIVIKNNPQGGTLIAWGLGRGFCDLGPYRFDVEWAETAEGDWSSLQGIGPSIDTYFTIDPHKRTWAKEVESYYRITLTTAAAQYRSTAKNANSFWGKRDWLLGREICRKEHLLMRKFTGWEGFLLKRKVWGPRCSVCTDFDTGEVSDGKCLNCFGTGITGGYWPGYPNFVYDMSAGPRQFKEQDDNAAMKEDIILPNMRILAYPHISTNDVFVHEGSGRRYYVRPVTIIAELKGIPVVYQVELRLAPYTDVIYKTPVEPDHPVHPYGPEPGPPPPPGPVDSEGQPIKVTVYRIFWQQGEWYLGAKLGNREEALYRTNHAYPLATGLDSFTWLAVTGVGDFNIAPAGEGYTVGISDNVEASGVYLPTAKDYSGLTQFALI